MNYRHIYHAGNFADVMKHLAVALVIDYLKKKEAPFCVIDAHGGIGQYDLTSVQAQKTMEWQAGIGRFAGLRDMPEDFALYYDQVRGSLADGFYPGSPLIAADMLREGDRLIANELHPDDYETLRGALARRRNVRVTHMDAYECIRAHIPPEEKRGLVLIDPPFEKTDEFQTLIRQMQEWKKRFAGGVFMIWYPIKAHLAVDEMKGAAVALGLHRTWCAETLLHPRRQEGTFNGCGLIVFNAPYQVPERFEAMLPFLGEKMELAETQAAWLTPA
ncbi:MAG TPA: 23S rRNA (adenine(2030)-N(6))-methyltransferase RlmJ [Micavibrio sp.]|nr:23S rRNA (adenine(2030)-N(6))-methyltransferase RlmJ [Micavibrio sp.]